MTGKSDAHLRVIADQLNAAMEPGRDDREEVVGLQRAGDSDRAAMEPGRDNREEVASEPSALGTE